MPAVAEQPPKSNSDVDDDSEALRPSSCTVYIGYPTEQHWESKRDFALVNRCAPDRSRRPPFVHAGVDVNRQMLVRPEEVDHAIALFAENL
jgi:hypothetical protein